MRSYHEEHYALQAAVAGQGLVLASSVMVSDMVDNGLLVAYRPEVRVPGAAYSVLCAPGASGIRRSGHFRLAAAGAAAGQWHEIKVLPS